MNGRQSIVRQKAVLRAVPPLQVDQPESGAPKERPIVSTPTYELIKASLAGDKQSANELVKVLSRLFEREVGVWVYFRRGNRQDVEDLVNRLFADLFAKGAEALRKYDPNKGASPETFFRRFARFRLQDYHRADRFRSREKTYTPEDMQDIVDVDLPAENEAEYLRGLRNEEIIQRLKKDLTEEQYTLFEERCLLGRSIPDLCQRYGVSEDVVYKRLSRMVALLRTKGYFEDEED